MDLKHRSRALTEGPERAPARTYLKGIGLTDEDLAKPIIGVASTWIETMPCNFHLRALAAKVKEGVRAAGGTPMEFNTIAISDGITMGTSGMKTSLVSREVIADSIELVARGHLFDAVIALSGCDKTIPGTVMALARLDVPGLMLYGGSVAPGRFHDRDVTILDVFEAVGAVAAGRMTEEELAELEQVAHATAGACGSTNAVLLLLAVAREAGVELDIDDFDCISERTPLLADLKPGGHYNAVDLFEAGGVPVLLQRLQDAGLLHDDAPTVDGTTI